MSQIIDLDDNVMQALDFFIQNPPPEVDFDRFDLPLVVGSGNAYNTGLIIFSDRSALFADESNFRKIVTAYKKIISQGLINQALVISASGGKDSVWELELAKENGLKTTLLTTKAESDAAKVADEVVVYKSIDEPYTYNVSTYMGMILSATKEDSGFIKEYIQALEVPENFDNYSSYAFVLPDKFGSICPMLDIKKSELFGPNLSLRAFPQGHARHAKFVIRSKEELVISIGSRNEFYGDPASRWNIEQTEGLDFAGIMALTYYLVGKIQKSKQQFYKENIENYVKDYGPKAYGKSEPFDLIVPGSG